jgi:hypothetical protein
MYASFSQVLSSGFQTEVSMQSSASHLMRASCPVHLGSLHISPDSIFTVTLLYLWISSVFFMLL